MLISAHVIATMGAMGSYTEFLKAAVKNPLQLSTIFQTSPWLARSVLRQVDFANAGHIMELGAGAGAITGEVARRLTPSCQFTAFEVVPSLAEYLKRTYPAQMEIVVGSAELASDYAKKKGPADAVVSSLPWTIFPEKLQEDILDSVAKSLKPGGKFMTYVCVNAELYPAAKSLKSKMKKKFSKVERQPTEWRNIPPASVYVCTKQ